MKMLTGRSRLGFRELSTLGMTIFRDLFSISSVNRFKATLSLLFAFITVLVVLAIRKDDEDGGTIVSCKKMPMLDMSLV